MLGCGAPRAMVSFHPLARACRRYEEDLDVNKNDLIEAVAAAAELSNASAARAVNAMFDAVTGALAKGDGVSIVGFGSFVVRERAAREGRNPQTGATIKIAASKVPGFKAGKALKDAIN